MDTHTHDTHNQPDQEDGEDSSIISSEDSSADEDGVDVERYWPPPIEEKVEFIASVSSKSATALAFNNSGTRFAVGGHDQQVNIWDFAALEPARPAPVCNVQPCGQTVIKNLSYNEEDELMLIVPGSCQVKIITKDGLSKAECPKGDLYLSDMSKTKGHVQILNDGCWNPRDKAKFMTCSKDSTIRIWDINNLSQQQTVIKTRSPVSGQKSVASACKYALSALSIIAGCNDGCILIWDTRRKFLSTSFNIKNAHCKGNEITDLQYSHSQFKLCSRSDDETLKVWDTRNLKAPLAKLAELITDQYPISCCFSPDDKTILTGTSCTTNAPGQLLFLNSDDLSIIKSIDIQNSSVIRCAWHSKINHIAYSCSNGSAFVCYDKERSIGGMKLALDAVKAGMKRKKYVSMQASINSGAKKIFTPHALPMFKDDNNKTGKSAIIQIRNDPSRSYKPEIPASATSRGGRIAPAGSTLSSFIAKNIAKPIDDGSMDIRERILRHASDAETNPKWFKKSAGDTAPQYQLRQDQSNDTNTERK